MKKNKAIVFALLGVLSVSAITAGAFYGTTNNGLHANATITSDCSLTWNNANRPELKAGAGSAISGHTIIEYTGAEDAPIGSHVTLGVGGKVFNDVSTKWNNHTGLGGVINGIERVVIRFKNNSAGKAKLKLEVKHFNHSLKVVPDIASGFAIDLTGGEGLANRFELTCVGTEGTIDIESIEIGCTKSIRNELDVNSPRDLVEAYKVNGDHLGSKATWKANFGKGDIIALKVKANHREELDVSQIRVRNGGLINKKIDGVDTICVVANPIEGNNYVVVDVDGYTYPVVHETGNFLGTFKVYDLYEDKIADVEVKNTGRINYNGVEGDYTVTFKDVSNPDTYQVNFTYNDHPTTLTKVDENLVVADETIGSRHVYHLGYKDICNIDKIYKGGQSDVIAKLDNGTVHHTIVIDDSILFVSGVDGINIGAYPQGDIVQNGKIYIEETVPLTGESRLAKIYAEKAIETKSDDTNKTLRVVMGTKIGPDALKREAEAGSYTNATDTIILDGYGFYNANIAGKESNGTYEYLPDTNELVLDAKTTYIIDVANKTFETPAPAADTDPFASVAKKYMYSDIMYIFFNGNLTVAPITKSAKAHFSKSVIEVPYTYEKGIVKASIPEYKWVFEDLWSDFPVAEPHAGPLELSFTYIDGNLKPTDKLVAIDGTTKETVIGVWTTLKPLDDPWAGKSVVYKLTLNDIFYSVSISNDKATFETNDPKLDGAYIESTAYYVPTSTGFKFTLAHACEDGTNTLEFALTPEGNVTNQSNYLTATGGAISLKFGSTFVKQA